jgi:hypothetical protein
MSDEEVLHFFFLALETKLPVSPHLLSCSALLSSWLAWRIFTSSPWSNWSYNIKSLKILPLHQILPKDRKSLVRGRQETSEMISQIGWWATQHSKNRCAKTVSDSLQKRHVLSSMLFLLAKLSLVRTLLTWSLGGTRILHITWVKICFTPLPFTMVYKDCTKYFLQELYCHIMASSS